MLNPRVSNLDKFDWGLTWSPAGSAYIGLKHESSSKAKSALSFGKFFLFVNHAATQSQVVGTEFTLDWATRVVQARLGFLHRFNSDTTGKFKVNEIGQVNAVLKHKINSSITATFATGFSLKGIIAEQKSKSLPVGLSFDIKL